MAEVGAEPDTDLRRPTAPVGRAHHRVRVDRASGMTRPGATVAVRGDPVCRRDARVQTLGPSPLDLAGGAGRWRTFRLHHGRHLLRI